MGNPWTPGPWEIGHARTKARGIDVVQRALSCVVASVYVPRYSDSSRQEADARLIAAAPEMAEALEYLEDAASCLVATFGYVREDYPERSAIHTHEGHTEEYLVEMVGKARALLSRIRGDAS